ncbi:sigma-54 interaction domain-containing protein [Solibacillus sp. FSL H8-0538]|uniref:sigma-54 interaction domain-containing protein n=1 Tax=Solibacillus sp. FSL H8-0538 TaxID=2921400 RepID=UPI0030F97C66
MDLQQLLLQQYDGVVITDLAGIISDFFVTPSSFLYEGKMLYSLQELELRIFEEEIFPLISTKEKQYFYQRTKMGIGVMTTVFTVDDSLAFAYKKIVDNAQTSTYIPSISSDFPFVVNSPSMYEVYKTLMKTSKTGVTVLLLGESGVGKEMAARKIHKLGVRKNGPFVAINCGAIPDNLIENELFGHVEGAYTGALKGGSIGKFRQAEKGVLFLDEIGELPLPMQVKILRVLQERIVTPIGSSKSYPIDVQIVSATNQNLAQLVKEGKFREDLYYRLNIVPIHIPALRDRVQEIPSLIAHFIRKYNEKYGLNVVFSNDVIDFLCVQEWKGNVRELENSIERLVVLADEEVVTSNDVAQLLKAEECSVSVYTHFSQVIPLKEAFDLVEAELIEMAMERYKSTTLAASVLGISQPTMSRKLQKLRENQTILPHKKRAVLEEQLDKRLRSIAVVTAVIIPIKQVLQVIDEDSDETREVLSAKLTELQRLEGAIHWVYIFKKDTEGQFVNVACCDDFIIEIGKAYNGPLEVMDVANEAMKGKVGVTSVYEDQYGKWKTCFAPLMGEDGTIQAIIGYDYSNAYIMAELDRLGRQLNVKV